MHDVSPHAPSRHTAKWQQEAACERAAANLANALGGGGQGVVTTGFCYLELFYGFNSRNSSSSTRYLGIPKFRISKLNSGIPSISEFHPLVVVVV